MTRLDNVPRQEIISQKGPQRAIWVRAATEIGPAVTSRRCPIDVTSQILLYATSYYYYSFAKQWKNYLQRKERKQSKAHRRQNYKQKETETICIFYEGHLKS